jgi:hypothetical protein
MVQADSYNPLYTLNYRVYGLSFFVRRYKDLGNSFSLFVEGALGGTYIPQKGRYEGADVLYVDSKGYSIDASLSGGIAYSLTRRWMVETGFQNLAYASYGHDKSNGASQVPEKYNSFGLGTNLNRALNNFTIGCRYILD